MICAGTVCLRKRPCSTSHAILLLCALISSSSSTNTFVASCTACSPFMADSSFITYTENIITSRPATIQNETYSISTQQICRALVATTEIYSLGCPRFWRLAFQRRCDRSLKIGERCRLLWASLDVFIMLLLFFTLNEKIKV